MSQHESPAAFRKMAYGEASPAEAKAIVRHLLAGCPHCREIVDELRRELGDPRAWDYAETFGNLEERLPSPPRRAARPRFRTGLAFAH